MSLYNIISHQSQQVAVIEVESDEGLENTSHIRKAQIENPESDSGSRPKS
jgi:hypothetical protein